MTTPPPTPSPEPEVEEIDLEEHSKTGKPVPPAKRYRIRIDRKTYTVSVPEMTGAQILELAGHTQKSHKLFEKVRGQAPEPIAPNQTVSFRKPGVERFQTIPIDPGEGIEVRRDFALSEEDSQALDDLLLRWETVKDGEKRLVLMHEFPTGAGYNAERATAALQMPAGYPDSQIDMVFFCPPLARRDGKEIPATTGRVTFDQRVFQQWSRHRTPANPWRPGVDGIGTHVLMVQDWLAREFLKN